MSLTYYLFGLLCTADPRCRDAALELPRNPAITAFRKCAEKKPISPECCRKLLPFAKYIDCTNDPRYRKAAEDYLRGVTTVEEVQASHHVQWSHGVKISSRCVN
ncbi:hypothetical protein VOLCADRAFT_118936 [Volvox carteri f. nagariensis]|uniref:Uncharacterized protein n=1 Tax=Volvox carteri f. nagariensis TaxID=3068 RepID=D8U8T0_VOLCA|nr:uncharacterized protein VOLCADRAFT_118936 [Volvox carteri f. nagariensis]EFJ43860.1 hypothetical protein VOLCADRAFT_118936 [Volvox carteri f. nagariensis]|eukprot:XP_002955106.1 hypothetical protein VOLCADRAFT_118936 [Volvox carteri f. nagariensis]